MGLSLKSKIMYRYYTRQYNIFRQFFKMKNKIIILSFFYFFIGCGFTNYNRNSSEIKEKINVIGQELSAELENHTQKIPEKTLLQSQKNVYVIKNTKDIFEFEAEGNGISTKYERVIDAEKRAEEEALSKAVRESGVNVYSGFQNLEHESNASYYQFIAKYINVWSSALVSYERIATNCSYENSVNKCSVKIKGKIFFKGDIDPVFELKTDLSKPAYYEGDEINLSISVSKDSYITVLSCDEDGNVSLVFPNTYSIDNFIKAGQELNIPGNMDFKMRAVLPAGRLKTIEMLHIIATKTQPLVNPETVKSEKSGKFITYPLGSLKELSFKLAKFQRSDWTSQVIVYEIKKKQN